MGKIKVKIINYTDTYLVRNEVLRPNKPIDSCRFLGDDDINTNHFGLFLDDNLVGVASVFKVCNDNFIQKNQFQLRGMAVLDQYQGLGYGILILNTITENLKSKNVETLWFNARENAVEFYKKLGFSVEGNQFEIPDVGAHFMMFKHFVV